MSAHYRGNLPPILDNLIHEKRVPPIVAVMVHNGGGDAQGSQRGLEYDTVSGNLHDFIETEVLPESPGITASSLPRIPRAARRWAGVQARRAHSRWPGSIPTY